MRIAVTENGKDNPDREVILRSYFLYLINHDIGKISSLPLDKSVTAKSYAWEI